MFSCFVHFNAKRYILLELEVVLLGFAAEKVILSPWLSINVRFHRNRCVLLKDVYWRMKNVNGFLSSDRHHLVCPASHYKLCIWCLIVVMDWKFSDHCNILANQEQEQKPIVFCLFSHAWQVEWVEFLLVLWCEWSACISTPASFLCRMVTVTVRSLRTRKGVKKSSSLSLPFLSPFSHAFS